MPPGRVADWQTAVDGIQAKPPPVSTTNAPRSDDRHRPTLLLAEDHPKMARVLGELLAKDFDIVAIVPDGERLIALAGQLHPVVIVADMVHLGREGV